MEGHKIGYKSYWLAYFDLLGFASKVAVNHAIGPILAEYLTALAEIRQNPQAICCKWFSDTFLFYASDDSEKAFPGIEYACQSFFYRMVRSYIPVRGCLTVGDFYEDASDGVLIGPALIDAYRLAERQDWLGFVLSPRAVRRAGEQSAFRGDHYRGYEVPIDHGKSTKNLQAFVVSAGFPPFPPYEWWRCLHDMEHQALTMLKLKGRRGEQRQAADGHSEEEKRVLQKYRNSKEYLLDLYPQLAEFVQDKYGPIPFNEPSVRKRIRESCWPLK